MNLQLRYSSCVVVLVVLFMVAGASGAAASQAKQAVVSCEEASAPISFAAEEVRAAETRAKETYYTEAQAPPAPQEMLNAPPPVGGKPRESLWQKIKGWFS